MLNDQKLSEMKIFTRNENRWMEEKIHGERIDVICENGKSTGRDSGQGCIEVRVTQLRPATRETQNHLDFQSKKK